MKLRTVLITGALLGMAHTAAAGGYFSGTVGNTSMTAFAEPATSLQFSAGTRLADIFALEIGYLDTGELTDISQYNGADLENRLQMRGLNFSVMGFIPLGESLDIYGKLGQYTWRADVNTFAGSDGSSADLSIHDSDLSYGAGILMHLSERIALKADYQVVDFAADQDGAFGNAQIASLGFTFSL